LEAWPAETTDGQRGRLLNAGHKDAGSQQNGWELLRERLKNVMKPEGPRLFVFNNCRQLILAVPVLRRGEIDMDDVDSAAEDHVGEAGTRLQDKGKTGSAAARYLAFPAEHEVLELGLSI
jgi:hypothetical protein